MKVNRTYCLDLDIVKKLKEEDNASELINKLLFEYYKENSMTEEQIIQQVKNRIINRDNEERNRIEQEKIRQEQNKKAEAFAVYSKLYPPSGEEFIKGHQEGKYKDYVSYIREKQNGN